MGRRAGAESAVAVIAAFYRRQRWRQAELAREVGISSEALGTVMRKLQDRSLPLTIDDSDLTARSTCTQTRERDRVIDGLRRGRSVGHQR